MTLRELTAALDKPVASGDLGIEANGVTSDSRQVKPGMVFVAVRGELSDGHDYIEKAIKAGAVAVVAEVAADQRWKSDLVWVHVSNARLVLSRFADLLAGQPSQDMKVIGITGTNGKTTTTFLAHHVMTSELLRAGLLGTVKFHNGLEEIEATHTTPGAVELQQHLSEMRDNGCRGVAMEVSSHGIEQQRVESVSFDVAVFTNLTQDHLDYHGSMEAYYEAKKGLFDQLMNQKSGKRPVAVINLDDAYGDKLIKDIDGRLPVSTFGFGVHCDFRATDVRQTARGTEFKLHARGKSYLVRTPLIGRFNVYNALAVITACAAAGIRPREAVKALQTLPQVPGRMEHVGHKNGFNVFVDYAHTPDAVANACQCLKELEPSKLITVFGCGGDRDKTKRPLMAEAASKNSDFCIITSDNPRSEDPAKIIEDVEKGMANDSYKSISNRKEAIDAAIEIAKDGDIILIAGKGHETYQEFSVGRVDFDDRAVARKALQKLPEAEPKQKKPEFKKDFSKDRDRDRDRNRDSGRRQDRDRKPFRD